MSEPELSYVRDLLCLHPRCCASHPLDDVLMRSLPTLASYAEAIGRPEKGDTWERILKIELGSALLRSAGKVFLSTPGGVLVVTASSLDGVEQYFHFLPVTPLILIAGEGQSAESVETLYARLKAKGHPVLLMRIVDLREQPIQRVAEILDFLGLPGREFGWQPLESGALDRRFSSSHRAGRPTP